MVENPPPQDNMRMASPTCHAAVYQVPRCAFDDQVYTTHFASAGISQRQEVCYSGPPPRQPSLRYASYPKLVWSRNRRWRTLHFDVRGDTGDDPALMASIGVGTVSTSLGSGEILCYTGTFLVDESRKYPDLPSGSVSWTYLYRVTSEYHARGGHFDPGCSSYAPMI